MLKRRSAWHLALTFALVSLLVVGMGAPLTGAPKPEVVIKAAVRQDASGPDRALNLQRAVERLNRKLTDVSIKLELEEHPTASWAEEATLLMRVFAAGEGPDIYTVPHVEVSRFSKAGHALILDNLIKKYPETYNDFIPSLWPSVKFRGSIYAIPQDVEARMIYFRVDRLKQFGWSDAQIRQMVQRVQQGQFTLQDMAALAQQVKERGVVEWGFYHRPVRGPDYYQLILAFGGQLQDSSGKLVLDRSSTLEFLRFLHDLVYKYKITPASMTNIPFRTILGQFGAEGKVLFWMGGIWQSGEFIRDHGVPANDFFNRLDWMLIPSGVKGGRPVTLSQPIVYVVSARSPAERRELAFRVVTEASATDLNAIHSVNSYHIAIRKSVTGVAEYKNHVWLNKATPLLEYTTFQPIHEDFPKYDQFIFEAIQAVETNRLSPEAALAFVEQQMKAQIGAQLVVKD